MIARPASWKCSRHRYGVDPTQSGKFYDDTCCVCRDRKARGLVTGNEPKPSRRATRKFIAHGYWRLREQKEGAR